jgi:hypothetical protein
LTAWQKADPARHPNGLLMSSSPQSFSALPSKADERPVNRFPGLSEYLGGSKTPSTNTGTNTGYASMLNAGAKILSPPKAFTNGSLGGFGSA